MVFKESRFNQSETACSLCVRIKWCFPCLPARDSELTQTQHFCHHLDIICHPNSSYVTTKLYETSACGYKNDTVIQRELFSRFLPSTYAGHVGHALVTHAKVARWRHYWIITFPLDIALIDRTSIVRHSLFLRDCWWPHVPLYDILVWTFFD